MKKMIGKNIKRVRIEKGVKQMELANYCGISISHLSNIEHGNVNITVSILMDVCECLKCNYDEILRKKINKDEIINISLYGLEEQERKILVEMILVLRQILIKNRI